MLESLFDDRSLIVLFTKYMIRYYPRVLKLTWEHLWISGVEPASEFLADMSSA